MSTRVWCEAVEARRLMSGGAASIVDLSVPAAAAGFTTDTVAGISPDGRLIVGQGVTAAEEQRAIVWTVQGHGKRRVTVLSSLGGGAFATAVNDAGVIVGAFHVTPQLTSATHACEWVFSARKARYVAVDLGTAVGGETGTASTANAINASGEVVGQVSGIPDVNGINGARADAVAWVGGGVAVNLSKTLHPSGTAQGLPKDGPFTASAVNDAGLIAGSISTLSGFGAEAYAWRIGAGNAVTPTRLGFGAAAAVAADGTVAVNTAIGDSITADALLYRPVTRNKFATTVFEAVSGGFRSFVSAMNGGGAAVGTVTDPNVQPNFVEAAVWRAKQGRLKVATLFSQLPAGSGWTSLGAAVGIDDGGDIVGSGQIGGETHSFLVT